MILAQEERENERFNGKKAAFEDQRTSRKKDRSGNTFRSQFPSWFSGRFPGAFSPLSDGLSVHGDDARSTFIIFPALATVAPCTCHWLHALWRFTYVNASLGEHGAAKGVAAARENAPRAPRNHNSILSYGEPPTAQRFTTYLPVCDWLQVASLTVSINLRYNVERR